MEIPLTQGKVAQIDPEDWLLVAPFKWQASCNKGKWYAQAFPSSSGAAGNRPCVLLHNLILPPPHGLVVDHKDGDGLNCRRMNMRLATLQQNTLNSPSRRGSASRFKGVSLLEGRWRAQIRIGSRNTCLGLFPSVEAAARAYDEAALRNHGEFARLNFAA